MAQFLKKFYLFLIAAGERLSHLLLLLMRLYWGYSFFLAGMGKLYQPEPVIQFFESLGIPFPAFSTYLTAYVEAVGGLMLLFGLGARLAAIPLAIVMATALYTAHSEAVIGFWENKQRLINQLPFNYLLTSLIVFCFGPGAISIDYFLGRKCSAE